MKLLLILNIFNLMKKCLKCIQILSFENFYSNPHTKDKYATWCKTCTRKYVKLYKSKNKVKVNNWQHSFRKRNKDKIKLKDKKYVLKSKFGITLEEYNNLLEKQNYSCSICKIHQKDLKRNLAVDHNHITKAVRGLLCTRCNLLIGFAKDSVEVLENTKKYLVKF